LAAIVDRPDARVVVRECLELRVVVEGTDAEAVKE
jgi:hypothetical protein